VLAAASVSASLASGLPTRSAQMGPAPGERSPIMPFTPLRGPIPLPNDGLNAATPQRASARVRLWDQLLLPEGFRRDVLLQRGDSLGSGRSDFNVGGAGPSERLTGSQCC
jgi:hypothetical protein